MSGQTESENATKNKELDALSGSMYFIVGQGTEGGPLSYRLSVAGVTNRHWGEVPTVRADSGYTLGAIQVDLGQRGLWPLGATDDRKLQSGEEIYVDSIISQAAEFSHRNGLSFAFDIDKLRSDMLSHGNGQHGRSSIVFIDTGTRDSINAWAASKEGKHWIHHNMDCLQIRAATQIAMSMLDEHGQNIPAENRLESISLLVKTINQMPSQLVKYEAVLRAGGNYDDLIHKADDISSQYSFYDGLKAVRVAEDYGRAYGDPSNKAGMDRANAKVASPDFNPATLAVDEDVRTALRAIGRPQPAVDPQVRLAADIQQNLNRLGVTDAGNRPLVVDGVVDASTQQAISAFQQRYGLKADGVPSQDLLTATQVATQLAPMPGSRAAFEQVTADLLRPHSPASEAVPDYLRAQQGVSAPAATLDDALAHIGQPAIAVTRSRQPGAAGRDGQEAQTPQREPHPTGPEPIRHAPDGAPIMHGPVQSHGPRDPRDPEHRDHAMYQGVRDRMKALYAEHGLAPTDQQLEQNTAAVMRDARSSGMTEVTRLAFSQNPATGGPDPNGNVFAYQGDPLRPGVKWSATSTQEAAQTQPDTSYRQFEQTTQQQKQFWSQFHQQQAQLAQQEQAQGQGGLVRS